MVSAWVISARLIMPGTSLRGMVNTSIASELVPTMWSSATTFSTFCAR